MVCRTMETPPVFVSSELIITVRKKTEQVFAKQKQV